MAEASVKSNPTPSIPRLDLPHGSMQTSARDIAIIGPSNPGGPTGTCLKEVSRGQKTPTECSGQHVGTGSSAHGEIR